MVPPHHPPDVAPFALPALDTPLDGIDDDAALPDRDAFQIQLPDSGDGDPLDDSDASDIPLDIELQGGEERDSAIDDDLLGLDDEDDHHVPLAAHRGASLLDDGGAPPLIDGDDELGIDPIPLEQDDGGLEGLEDPSADVIDSHAFPTLDGAADDDDDEIDVGLTLPPLTAAVDSESP